MNQRPLHVWEMVPPLDDDGSMVVVARMSACAAFNPRGDHCALNVPSQEALPFALVHLSSSPSRSGHRMRVTTSGFIAPWRCRRCCSVLPVSISMTR